MIAFFLKSYCTKKSWLFPNRSIFEIKTISKAKILLTNLSLICSRKLNPCQNRFYTTWIFQQNNPRIESLKWTHSLYSFHLYPKQNLPVCRNSTIEFFRPGHLHYRYSVGSQPARKSGPLGVHLVRTESRSWRISLSDSLPGLTGENLFFFATLEYLSRDGNFGGASLCLEMYFRSNLFWDLLIALLYLTLKKPPLLNLWRWWYL
jgi:hypothetical protein